MEVNTDEENVLEKRSVPNYGNCFDPHLISCEVCFEIMYQPLNCSPCNHKFCASCIYRWLDTHFTCPKCRVLLKEVTKDQVMNQLVQWYLNSNPERYRNQDAIDELDRVELEFLEKLSIRARGPHLRGFPYSDKETDQLENTDLLDLLGQYAALPATPQLGGNGLILQRKLLLGSSKKYREAEWDSRIRYLREKFHFPAPVPPPPTPPLQDQLADTLRYLGGEAEAAARRRLRIFQGGEEANNNTTSARNQNRPSVQNPSASGPSTSGSNTNRILPLPLPGGMTQAEFAANQRNAMINAISGVILGREIPWPGGPRRRRNPRDPQPRDPYPLRRRPANGPGN